MPKNIFLIFTIWTIFVLKIRAQSFDISIKENIPKNTFISDLTTFDQNPSDSSKSKQFTLISERKANSLFELKPNGKLLSSKLIDREKLCSQTEECCDVKKPCIISILVAVSSEVMQSPKTFECRIEIVDENDNAPNFAQNNITILIKESEQVGSLFPLPLATDLDSEKYSIRQYKLIDDNSHPQTFSLEQSRVGNIQNLQLIQRLDREKRSSYELTLSAIDGGSPPLTGKLLISIKVVDVNDNPPKLLQSNYKVSIAEDMFQTQPILTIEATDEDEGENAELHYRIIDENPTQNDANKFFKIDQATGKMFLNEKLDYEKQELYRFFVEVSNKNENIDSATATVLINVENRNDERPEISISYLNGDKNTAFIPENDVRSRFVALATVTDKDKGIGGQVTCKLANYLDTFEIQIKDPSRFSNQYDIQTKVSLDREKVALYQVIMECEDRGYPVQTTKKTINVNVQDVNDNSPVVSIDPRVSVKENRPRGTLVTRIRATDDDKGRNGELSFSISDSEDITQRLLEIDPLSGELRTKEVIDREVDREPVKELPVVLVVSDKGKPSLSVVKSFTVTVTDENDNPPQFAKETMEFSVTENQPERFLLGEIIVNDNDDESKLKLTLVPSSDHHPSPFLIYKKDNRFFLNTTKSLDWEKEKSFVLSVVANDGSLAKSHSVTATIRVTVKDDNDNSPIIIFPSQRNFSTPRLSVHERRGFTILTVSAMDKDSPETDNGKLFYEMSDPRDLFSIDSSRGTIRTDRKMTSQDIGHYKVKVVVRDHGSPSRNTSIDLWIDIDDSTPSSHSDGSKDNDDNGKSSPTYFMWTKEGFLVISLVILLFFLLICVLMILYMRHMRGMFPALPDIFQCCRKGSKNRKCSKGVLYGKSHSNIPSDSNQMNSPLSFQQTNRNTQEKSLPPYYLNKYDSSGTCVTFPIDNHVPVNPYRQYETLKYQPFSGNHVGLNPEPGSSTYSYDKLFYSPMVSNCEGTMQVPGSRLNSSNLYDSRTQMIPDSISLHPQISHRIINNIDCSPLIGDGNAKEGFPDRFSSDQSLKFDDAEKLSPDQSLVNIPGCRGHARPSEKIDTYAITYPLEQSTFV